MIPELPPPTSSRTADVTAPEAAPAELHLSEYWAIIKKRRRLIALCVFVALVIAVVAGLLTKKAYQATVVLDVEKDRRACSTPAPGSGSRSTRPVPRDADRAHEEPRDRRAGRAQAEAPREPEVEPQTKGSDPGDAREARRLRAGGDDQPGGPDQSEGQGRSGSRHEHPAALLRGPLAGACGRHRQRRRRGLHRVERGGEIQRRGPRLRVSEDADRPAQEGARRQAAAAARLRAREGHHLGRSGDERLPSESGDSQPRLRHRRRGSGGEGGPVPRDADRPAGDDRRHAFERHS